MFDLLFGSTNRGKIIEMREGCADLPIAILSPLEFDINNSPEETGSTFKENAKQKADFYFSKSGMHTFADDSGILVEALKDELGIHTRRWGAGKSATDAEWIAYFLERMKKETNRAAKFVCVLCFIDANGEKHFFEGWCDGVITEAVESTYLPGLPISACFKPDGFNKVYSALSVEEKNAISHRGKALSHFKKYLRSQI